MRAVAILAATHDVVLVAAGATTATEAAYLRECRRLADELGVADRFTWLGQIDRVGKLRLLETCDVFAMPTAHPEAKGLPVIEAMAAGVPVVAPEQGAFPELLACGGGLLHAPNDPADLARLLRNVLDDSTRAAALGAAGHACVRERHTFATMAAGHEAVYAEVLAEDARTTCRAETGSDSRDPYR